MGLNFRKRVLLKETVLKNCENCKKVFPEDKNFCECCGSKLSAQKTQVFANMGMKGITSVTFKLANGITINSKGKLTVPMSTGLSYTTRLK